MVEAHRQIRIYGRSTLRRIRRNRRKQDGRTSWAYCPNCRRDLNGDNDSFVGDMGSLVRYTCATCGTNSEWEFDAPVPLYLGGW